MSETEALDGRAGEPDRPKEDPGDSRQESSQSRGSGKHATPKKGGALRELPVLVILALVLALLIKTFLIQAFVIPSPSMLPTLEIDDRVLVNKLAYTFGEPQRGDVIVFLNPNRAEEEATNPVSGFFRWLTHGLGIDQPADEDFIKRVIGTPGDRVKVTDDGVWVNGEKLVEPYISANGGPNGEWNVPKGEVFVMGDNRSNSSDSRAFEHHSVPIDTIVGKAFVRIWPPGRWGGL